MKKMVVSGLVLSLFPGICLGAMNERIYKLVQEKQQKMEKLQQCQGTTQKLKIAGISTLGITAVGVGANIAEAVVLSDKKDDIKDAKKEYEKQLHVKQAYDTDASRKLAAEEAVVKEFVRINFQNETARYIDAVDMVVKWGEKNGKKFSNCNYDFVESGQYIKCNNGRNEIWRFKFNAITDYHEDVAQVQVIRDFKSTLPFEEAVDEIGNWASKNRVQIFQETCMNGTKANTIICGGAERDYLFEFGKITTDGTMFTSRAACSKHCDTLCVQKETRWNCTGSVDGRKKSVFDELDERVDALKAKADAIPNNHLPTGHMYIYEDIDPETGMRRGVDVYCNVYIGMTKVTGPEVDEFKKQFSNSCVPEDSVTADAEQAAAEQEFKQAQQRHANAALEQEKAQQDYLNQKANAGNVPSMPEQREQWLASLREKAARDFDARTMSPKRALEAVAEWGNANNVTLKDCTVFYSDNTVVCDDDFEFKFAEIINVTERLKEEAKTAYEGQRMTPNNAREEVIEWGEKNELELKNCVPQQDEDFVTCDNGFKFNFQKILWTREFEMREDERVAETFNQALALIQNQFPTIADEDSFTCSSASGKVVYCFSQDGEYRIMNKFKFGYDIPQKNN